MAALLIGLDEAGYGPMLGPLVLGGCALEVPQAGIDAWQALASAVAARASATDERLLVADSKLFQAQTPAGRARLEATALAFLELAGVRDPLWLVRGTCAPDPRELALHPWYAELGRAFPLGAAPAEVERATRALEQAARDAGVRVRAARVRLVPEGEFNRDCGSGANKADCLWKHGSALLQGLVRPARETSGAELEERLVLADRQGGRTRYWAALAQAFPDWEVRALCERAELAEYALARAGESPLRVRFEPRADGRHFATALASCLAKYARECAMDAFNRYFARLAPELRPTAGYVQDARRWLGDAHALLESERVPRELLVRAR